jgi:BON domain-containing protein
MLQVPFGSTGPGWITLPSPGVGWFPASLAPTGPSLPGAQLQGSNPMSTADTGSFGWGAHGMTVPMTPLPLSTPFVVPDGITAPVLLAAIAQRRGQPQGPTSDNDVEEFIYDALEVLPGAQDVEVRCEGGRVTLTGSVPHKRLKRDVGEIAWAIPGINDVQNNAGIATRRRSRAFARESEAPPSAPARKQS